MDATNNNSHRQRSVCVLECNHIITRLDRRHAVTDRLDDSGPFVTQNDGEGPLGVFSGQGVGIWAVSDFRLGGVRGGPNSPV